MKRAIRTKGPFQKPAAAAPARIIDLPVEEDASEDELAIRYSLTALGELAVAQGERGGRGRRFRGFGPCGAVA